MKTLIVLAVVVSCAAAPVSAQSACGAHDEILKTMQEKFGEQRLHIAMTSDGSVLEITVSPQGGWTALITDVSGMTCLVAAGEAWQTIPTGVDG